MKKIKLAIGKFVLVDNKDFKWLNKWRWYYNRGYAVREQCLDIVNGKRFRKIISMHRLINNTPINMMTDHINRVPLDNRRCNLRTASRSLNGINRGKPKHNISGYKGVYWDTWSEKWRAEIGLNGKNFRLGRFIDIKDAVKARLKAEKIYHNI